MRRARGCRSDVSRHDCRVACSWAEFRRRWVHISLTRRREYGDAAYSVNLYRRAGPPLVSVTFAQRKMKPAPCRPPWAWLCVLLHSTEHQEIKEMRVLRSAAGAKEIRKIASVDIIYWYTVGILYSYFHLSTRQLGSVVSAFSTFSSYMARSRRAEPQPADAGAAREEDGGAITGSLLGGGHPPTLLAQMDQYCDR